MIHKKTRVLGDLLKMGGASEAAKETDTKPTDAQKDAGNYKKGKFTWNGLQIAIENPKGSFREGVSKDGKKWRVQLQHHYGYVKGTTGKDGDQVDVFIGDNLDSDKIYIINQVDPKTREFDEHKVIIGFNNKADAESGYLKNHEKDWDGIGNIREKNISEFKQWLSVKSNMKKEASRQ